MDARLESQSLSLSFNKLLACIQKLQRGWRISSGPLGVVKLNRAWRWFDEDDKDILGDSSFVPHSNCL